MTNLTLDEAREALAFSAHDLDVQLEEHPQLFATVALRVVQLEDEHRRVQRVRRQILADRREEAVADLEARKKKTTEASISGWLENDQECIEAGNELYAASLELKQWQVLRDAMVQKSYAMRERARLMIDAAMAPDSVGSRRAR